MLVSEEEEQDPPRKPEQLGFVHTTVLFAYWTTKQDTTQATPFELVYGRIAMLSVEREISTYPAKPITEENFQETLLRRTYDLMETLENK
ncbi:hypothetical protein G9A89_012473 [Geosiphon pyriformis]|nr:hypothetical protein G9A89_012473 [Geosiphon pyriformis]